MKALKNSVQKNAVVAAICLLLTCPGTSCASMSTPAETEWTENFIAAAKSLDRKSFKDAHQHLLKCLDEIGNDPIKAIATLNALERLYEEIGNLADKERVLLTHLKVLDGYRFPKDCYAEVYFQLGEIAATNENYKKAELYFSLALPILKHYTGEYHSDVGITLNNLAYAELRLHKTKLAETHYKQALDVFHKSMGMYNLFYAFTAGNLGDFYEMSNRPDIAASYFKKALESFSAVLGSSDPLTQEIKNRYDSTRSKQHGKAAPMRPTQRKDGTQAPKKEESAPRIFPDLALLKTLPS
jgi:tetratricopeptide (TPR) repeat protein